MDETTLTVDPPLRACWMKIGQQKRVPATRPGIKQKRVPATRPGIKQKRHVFGGYDWTSDTVTWTIAETKNSAQFIGFLEHLLIMQYPTGRVVLVMDNAAYHKSAPSLAALSLFEHRVLIIWLPTYCSELNTIERYWRHLKDQACANKLQDSIDEVVKAAENALIDQNKFESASRYHVSRNL